MLKKCLHCKQEKQEDQFRNTRTAKGKVIKRPECIVCANKYAKEYARKHNNYGAITKRQRKKRYENKLKAIEYLGNRCNICLNKFNIVAYDFHHTENNKEKAIGNMLLNKWENIQKELEKCQLLCANCHRILHYGEFLS